MNKSWSLETSLLGAKPNPVYREAKSHVQSADDFANTPLLALNAMLSPDSICLTVSVCCQRSWAAYLEAIASETSLLQLIVTDVWSMTCCQAHDKALQQRLSLPML